MKFLKLTAPVLGKGKKLKLKMQILFVIFSSISLAKFGHMFNCMYINITATKQTRAIQKPFTLFEWRNYGNKNMTCLWHIKLPPSFGGIDQLLKVKIVEKMNGQTVNVSSSAQFLFFQDEFLWGEMNTTQQFIPEMSVLSSKSALVRFGGEASVQSHTKQFPARMRSNIITAIVIRLPN